MTVKAINQLVKYQPTLQKRKWITRTTINNGGLHKQEEFKKAVVMMEYVAHNFRNPRLFHVCFTGADIATYQQAIIRFCRALTGDEVRYCYKAALEWDGEKGEHLHLMIVLEAIQQTPRFITSVDESGKIENESALRKAVRHTWSECPDLSYRVAMPKQGKGCAFLQFNQSNIELFNEAVEWLSYVYKARSKPEKGTVYFSGRSMPTSR